MICNKCKKENAKENLFCEFCGSKIKDNFILKRKVYKTSNEDLEKLKESTLYRLLKVVYFSAFLIAIILTLVYGLIKNPIIKKEFSGRKTLINCSDYLNNNNKLNFKFINIAKAGLLYKSTLKNAVELENIKIKKACDNKKYYLNLEFNFAQFIKVLIILFFVAGIFELIRRLTYYIFLGRFYP